MVEYIEYKGKNYPVRVNYYALTMLKKETGKDLKDIKEGELELYEPLLYYSLVAGCKIEDTALDLERDEMVWVLDVCLQQFVEALLKFYPPEEEGEENEKKQGTPANRRQRRQQEKKK